MTYIDFGEGWYKIGSYIGDRNYNELLRMMARRRIVGMVGKVREGEYLNDSEKIVGEFSNVDELFQQLKEQDEINQKQIKLEA